jgi:hypothetical protein
MDERPKHKKHMKDSNFLKSHKLMDLMMLDSKNILQSDIIGD